MKTLIAKAVLVAMLLMWALPFHANAAYPQTCTNGVAYSQCMSQCYSNIGRCFEYCPPSYCGGACSGLQYSEYVYDSHGVYQYTIQNYMTYAPGSGCQGNCVYAAQSCAAGCPSYCN